MLTQFFRTGVLIGAVACVGAGQVEPRDGREKRETGRVATPGHPECPGEGSCCVGYGGPGCDNTACCNIVCDFDFFCCIGWDSDCAAWAETLCTGVCAGVCPGEGDCCSAHTGGGCSGPLCCDLVCLEMPACCESGWNASCATLAGQICDECGAPPQFDCPQPGDCCTGRFTSGGCQSAACCQTVCEHDAVCCTEIWDDICAREAAQFCLNVCECEAFGDFDTNGTDDLRDAAAFQNCFSDHGSAPVLATCACADYDGDGDADVADWRFFAAILAP